MKLVADTGMIVAEPDWVSIFNDELEIAAAREHWRVISDEMRTAQTLTAANAFAMESLVLARILTVRMRRFVVEDGPVAKPKRNNPKAIARVSPYHQAMQDYLRDMVVLEDKLGLSPAHRNKAGKVDRGKKAPRAADRYLRAAG